MLNFLQWLESQEAKPKILWITGMNSTGLGVQKLKEMGYNVVQVPTITDWPTAILGRLKRYSVFKPMGNMADKWGMDHVARNVMQFTDIATGFDPDIVIGTSQGGAIAMKVAHKYPHAKFILGAPAWKIFNVTKFDLPPDTIIIHSKDDVKVPIQDSMELAKMTGATLKIISGSHSIAFEAIFQAVLEQSRKIVV